MPLFSWIDRRRRARRNHPPRGVLFVASGGLGDAVLFSLILPNLKGLARAGEPVSVLMPSGTAKMSFLFGRDVEAIGVDYNRIAKDGGHRRAVGRQLYDRNFRLVVSTDYLRHPKRDEVLIRACGAAETIAMIARPWEKYDRLLARNRGLYDRLFDSSPPLLDKVIRWNRFANWLSGEDTPAPAVRLPEDQLPAPASLQAPTIILVPFSAVPQKQSSATLFERIVDAVPEGHDIVVAGAPDDLEKNTVFRPLLERPSVRYDSATFEDLAPTLRAARLVVSVDTATMHLAVALGAPTLCLASAAYVDEIVPYAPEIAPPNAHFLYTPMDCQSCLGNCIHPPEDGMYPCVAQLEADVVVQKMQELLEGDPA